MISKNLQERNYNITIFWSFSFLFLIGIFLTNIYNYFIVYIFLIFFLIGLQIIIYFKKLTLIVIISLIGFLLGSFLSLYNLKIIEINQAILANKTENFTKKVQIVGKIDYNYSQTEDFSSYLVKIISLNNENINKNINLLIKVSKRSFLLPGNIISFEGKITKPENIDDFEYDKFLLLKDIYGQSYVYNFEIKGTELSIYKNFIFEIRSKFLDIINNIYPGDTAVFLGGTLIGAKTDLSKDLKTNFNRSGLTHIIAVSGFNITIIIAFLAFLLRYLPYQIKFIIITLTIVIFTSIVGDQISVFRASIMGLVSYYFLNFGKKINCYNFLILLVLLFSIINPLTLNYDINFHLSFLAVLGILYTQEFFKKIFRYVPNTFSVREALVLTFSALVFTIPITITNFGQLSIISPITNLLVTPFIPLVMLFGIISIIFYLIYPIIGVWIGFIAWGISKYILGVINYFGSLDFSVVPIDFGIYKYIVELIYFIIMIFLILYFRKEKK